MYEQQDLKLVGSRIKAVRISRGMSQADLLRPDVPEVKAIYQGEFAELLEDCSASEMETILKIVREVKASMHKKQNND